ncbi:hypothetical protein [Oceanibacterium hippocampi]|uniref:LTXXQ motif protein n=1 Tax=Oceanibacterium hippocampi TaxID=745714 RepID=A0A1Y5T6S2_9PROT|nr:hypothetical protein [Oceanibacterium hippocampi]SLN57193.1 hypothetical protein OCH7691_02492 [Oceanibacterium hippocampi]
MRSLIVFCGLVLFAFGAAAQAQHSPLHEAELNGFMQSFDAMQALGEKYDRLFEERGVNSGPNDSPFSQGAAALLGTHAYSEAEAIAQRYGFANLQHWATTGDRIMRAYVAGHMAGQAPQMDAAMAQARQQIMSNSSLTEQQKQEMLKQIEQAMGAVGNMSRDVPPEDIALVQRYRAELDRAFDAAE